MTIICEGLRHRRARRATVMVAAGIAGLSLSGPAIAAEFGPTDFPLTIVGVPVQIAVKVSYQTESQGSDVLVSATVEANLKNVQEKALDIVRALSVPNKNCAHQGINPVVNKVSDASLVPSGTNAVISISGRVTAWVCKKVSGFTLKTELPPKRVAMTITVPLSAEVIDHTRVGVTLAGPVSVTGDGLDGDILSFLSDYFQEQISKQLNKALDADAARAKFPTLPGLTVDIASVGFVADGPDLVIRSTGTAKLSTAGFAALLSQLKP